VAGVPRVAGRHRRGAVRCAAGDWITAVAVELVAVVLMTLVIRRLDARQAAYSRRLLELGQADAQGAR
jgi:hypothetical protein